MASTYALPASAMTHNHGHRGHGHLHSHSHSPGRPYSNTPRASRPDLQSSSLHSHSQSESHAGHEHSVGHNHAPDRGYGYTREYSPSPYLPTPPDSNSLPPISSFEKHTRDSSHSLASMGSFEPPLNAVNIIPHGHGHSHIHPHAAPIEQPRSRFTSFILPFVMRWPLLHTILAEKDSRRIFYFMRYGSGYIKAGESANAV